MHPHGVARLDLGQAFALVVEQEHRHGVGDVDHDVAGAGFRTFLLDRAQDVDRRAFDVAHQAEAGAVRAGDEAGFGEARAQALAAHFQQAEMADLTDLDAGAVVFQRLLQPALDHGVVALGLHVDEVDDDQAGEIAQAELAGGFLGGLQVGAQGGFLDAAFAGGTARVDVDGDQRLGLVDHQVAAGFELDGGDQHGVELVFHAVLGEERLSCPTRTAFGPPELYFLGVAGHQHAHEVARGAPALFAVNDHFVDVARVAVADGALDEAGFLVDQGGGHRFQRQLADVVPQSHQVFGVAADLGLGTVGAGSAHDQAHALRHFQLGGDFLEAAAIGDRGDLAGDAAAARRVRHQHAEAAGERDIGGQGRALGAALLLDDLDQHDLAAADHFLDAVVAQEARGAAGGGFLGAVALEDVAVAAHLLGRGFVFLDDIELGVVVAIRGEGELGLGGFGFGRLDLGRLGHALDQRGVAAVKTDFAIADGAEFDLAISGGGGRCLQGRFARGGTAAAAAGWLGGGLSGRRRGGVGLVLGGCLGGGFLGLHFQQALPVGDGDLVVVGMDFAEGQEAVAATAVFDEGRLERRFHPDDLGQVDIALQLLFGGSLDIEIFEPITVQHHHAGFFRVCGIDQHAFGHLVAHSGAPPARALRRGGGGKIGLHGEAASPAAGKPG